MDIQLIDDIKHCLAKKPRDNKVLMPLLRELHAVSNTNWLANIELTDCYVTSEDWAQALPAARATFALNRKNRRAAVLLARSLLSTDNPSEALHVLASLITPSSDDTFSRTAFENSQTDESLVTLFKVLGSDPQAWSDNHTLVAWLRNALLGHIKVTTVGLPTSKAIARIVPSNKLKLTETIRFLQLQSIIVGSNDLLECWLRSRSDSLSTESLFVIYLLLVRLGDFPESFKEFLPGQGDIAEFALQETVSKVRNKAADFCLQPNSGSAMKKLLFVLGSMPQTDWFLRTGAHYKVVVDYAHYLTEIDRDIEIDVLITNEISDEDPKILFGRWPVCHDAGIYARAMDQHYDNWDKDRIRFLRVEKGLSAAPVDNDLLTQFGVPAKQDYFDLALKKFESLNPDAIVWFGGVLESVVFPHVIAHRYPSVFRQFNTNNMPRGHFDVGMTYSEKVVDSNPGHWIKFDTAYSDLPTNTPLPKILRTALASSTNVITVANNLGARIDREFANMMITTLAAKQGLKWVLVGITDMAGFHKKYPDLQALVDAGRIICTGFIEYVGELLDQCHVFVYPKVGGGAGGMALAALRGIPVLCFADGDADALFNVEDMVADYATMEMELVKILEDANYRKNVGKRYQDKFGEAKFKTEAERLLNACKQAAVAWRENKKSTKDCTAILPDSRNSNKNTLIKTTVKYPFVRPKLPKPEAWLPYLQKAYESKHYTNYGHCEQRFTQRLASRFLVKGSSSVLCANATLGLTASLIALGIKGKVVIPAFTFPATLQAVLAAHCEAILCDVDPDSWELCPQALSRIMQSTNVAAIMPVRVFGFVRDFSEIFDVATAHGVPVVVDAAACLGNHRFEAGSSKQADVIEVFSLHATKSFGIGEGGAIFAAEKYEQALKQTLNFGINADRSFASGINGKMSEFQAAVGLSVLDSIDDLIDGRRAMAEYYSLYMPGFSGVQLAAAPGNTAWSNYPILMPEYSDLDNIAKRLLEIGLQARRYYFPSISTGYKAAALNNPFGTPVSDSLASRMLCLPLYTDASLAEMENIKTLLIDNLGVFESGDEFTVSVAKRAQAA